MCRTSKVRGIIGCAAGSSPSASFRGDASEVGARDRRHELAPVDPAGIADDVDARDACAFHDVVADTGGVVPGHLANINAGPGRDFEPVVAVFFAENEDAG